ncbi:MAG TPA: hypothetical protein VFT69_18985 [Pseudolabrys sp.]|nr:hypothetical protein [Pseudolabrys sp.]
MHNRVLIGTAVALSLTGMTTVAVAASADDFKAAYAKAEAASKKSLEMKTQWTTAVAELKAAKKAADAGKYDEAVKLATHAQALANASIEQAKEQEKLWADAVVR